MEKVLTQKNDRQLIIVRAIKSFKETGGVGINFTAEQGEATQPPKCKKQQPEVYALILQDALNADLH